MISSSVRDAAQANRARENLCRLIREHSRMTTVFNLGVEVSIDLSHALSSDVYE